MSVMRQTATVCWHDQTRHRPEIIVGRVLAACVHPFAAWRLLSVSWRLLTLAAYGTVAYITVLAALWLRSVQL